MQTINNPKTYELVCYIDYDKKTFNPGLIVSNPLVLKEVYDMISVKREEGRRIGIVSSGEYPDIESVPSGEVFAKIMPYYTYDPYLIW